MNKWIIIALVALGLYGIYYWYNNSASGPVASGTSSSSFLTSFWPYLAAGALVIFFI
jgi:hypothetical protein